MGNFLQTKEGEQAGLGGQSSLYNLITGERWVLYKSNKDPRGRIWHKVNKEGEIVDVKKGALNIGGNVAEWTKGGMGNTVNFAKDLPRNLLYHDLPRPKSKNKLKVNNNQVNPSTSFSDIYGREDLVRLSGKTSKTNNKGFMTRLSESFSDPSEIEPTGNKAVDEFFGYTGKPTNKSTKTPPLMNEF